MNPNLIVSIAGMPKSGKTFLALSFPDPLIVFSFDIGVDRVLPHYPGKNIEVKTYPIPILDTTHPKPYAKELVANITKDYKKAIAGDYKTVVMDTNTAVYELQRHGYAEELGQKQLLQFQYGEVYARMSAMLTQPRFEGVNLVLTHYLRPRYVGDTTTGELELDGYKRTEGLVDIVLLTERIAKPKGGAVIRTRIVDCGFDLDLCGYECEDMTYQTLIELLGFGGK